VRATLTSFIGKVDQPIDRISFTVKMKVASVLKDTQSGQYRWWTPGKDVNSEYTAKVSEGVCRRRAGCASLTRGGQRKHSGSNHRHGGIDALDLALRPEAPSKDFGIARNAGSGRAGSPHRRPRVLSLYTHDTAPRPRKTYLYSN